MGINKYSTLEEMGEENEPQEVKEKPAESIAKSALTDADKDATAKTVDVKTDEVVADNTETSKIK